MHTRSLLGLPTNIITFALLITTLVITIPNHTGAQVISSYMHTVAVCNTGGVNGWGQNDLGQLGDSSFINRSLPVTNGLTDVVAVAAGEQHSLFVKSDGTVWSTGNNNYGELGSSNLSAIYKPEQISGLTGITAVAAGRGFSLFLKNDGTVWACGANNYGQLGNGGGGSQSTPVQVSGLTNITAIAAGWDHSLFVKSDGTVWVCGQNNRGQLADGTNTEKYTPVQVNLTNVVGVAGSEHHSLFLKSDGTVWAAGGNLYSQLGNGTSTTTSVPVQVSIVTNVVRIAAGRYHSLFVKSDGTAWACGTNDYGQIGDGTTATLRTVPVQVSTLNDVIDVAAGFYHSFFLRSNGELWACGYNVIGQLGDGTYDDKASPVQIQNACAVALPPASTHHVSGILFNDANSNCSQQTGEAPLPFIPLVATPGNLYTFSNDTGYYSLGINDSVSYTLQPIIPQRLAHLISNPCPANYNVLLDGNAPADTGGFHFGLKANACHQLRVAIGESRKRRCFSNTVTLSYWNEGIATANNVEVRVKFDKYDIPVGASVPYTWNLSDSSMVFNIGSLSYNQYGTITIIDSIACINGLMGLTQCTRAVILPPNQCLLDSTVGPNWDNSIIDVSGTCVNDTVRFVIYNNGSSMAAASQYRIYADNVLRQTVPFQLIGADSLVVLWVSGGATIRIEADQHPDYPRQSFPRAIVEGCGTNGQGNFTTGAVNQVPQDDADVDVDISCLPILDSFDPNDKTSSPAGVGINRIVLPKTPVDFLIRFQNTGNDTAYKVVIVDTLSTDYDLSTLEPGAASHPHNLTISGEGQPVLTFTFNNINLVDSTTNEALSHGYVRYTITPKNTLPLGTRLNNVANIYFDFNPPIVTNNAFITLGVYDEDLSTAIAEAPQWQAAIFPNPSNGTATIRLAHPQLQQQLAAGNLQFTLYDVYGATVHQQALHHETTLLNTQLPSGMYLYRITGSKGQVANGKIAVK